MLKTFGLLPGSVRGLRFDARVELMLEGREELALIVTPLLVAWRQLREQIEQAKQELERAQRESYLAKASELKYGKLPELERQLKTLELVQSGKLGGPRLIKEEVTEEDIAAVVSRIEGASAQIVAYDIASRIAQVTRVRNHPDRAVESTEEVHVTTRAI